MVWIRQRTEPPLRDCEEHARVTGPLPARNRPNDNKRLLPGRDGIGERGVGRLVGEVFFAGEEAQERAALLRVVVADGSAQHGIARLERVEHGTQRDRSLDFERHLAADVRQVAEMEGEDTRIIIKTDS